MLIMLVDYIIVLNDDEGTATFFWCLGVAILPTIVLHMQRDLGVIIFMMISPHGSHAMPLPLRKDGKKEKRREVEGGATIA